MSYQIQSIRQFVRPIGPPRIDFALGKSHFLFPQWMRLSIETRLDLQADDGRSAVGCSADWPLFAWLDKRIEIHPHQKLADLLQLVLSARDAFMANREFETCFDCWWKTQSEFLDSPARSAVPLCNSFAIAQIERALIDAFCRLENLSFDASLRDDRLGFRAGRIHRELEGVSLAERLPERPLDSLYLRHTVGLNDPLVAADIDAENKLDDGWPQTLEDYVAQHGIKYFKIKIGGDVQRDGQRLARIWSVVGSTDPVVTLDANEAFSDPETLRQFLDGLASEQPDLFRQIIFVEQPFRREQSMDPDWKSDITAISDRTPLIIDESDGELHAFSKAVEVGYRGVSHKNCKGVFKSLANYLLCQHRNQSGGQSGKALFLTSEDLTNLPMVALQQDLAVARTLGLAHSERNGHHFFSGLQHLSPADRQSTAQYPGLYRQAGDQVVMRIENGQIDVSSLNGPGLGMVDSPEVSGLEELQKWLAEFRKNNLEPGEPSGDTPPVF